MSCGCRNSIHKGLGELNGVFGVRVEPQYDRIVIDHTDEVSRAELLSRLEKLGYEPLEEENLQIEPNENNFCGCTVGPSSDGLRRFRSEERRK